jgi:AbrB family looped-hinge helix DNA binding protein
MALARVRTRFQLTLPEEVRRQLSIKEGDTLEVSVADGGIVLTPVAPQCPAKPPRPGLTSNIGAAAGLFGSPTEADEFIAHERKAWD